MPSAIKKETLAQLRTAYEQGLTDRQLQDRFGISRTSIWRWRHDRGLPAHKPEKPEQPKVKIPAVPPETVEYIRGMAEKGVPDTVISRLTDLSYSQVRRLRYKYKIPSGKTGNLVSDDEYRPSEPKPDDSMITSAYSSNLHRDIQAAKALGISYGQYKARQYEATRPDRFWWIRRGNHESKV